MPRGFSAGGEFRDYSVGLLPLAKTLTMTRAVPLTWHVAYTKPRQEEIALLNLRNQGLEAMFPRYVFFKPRDAKQSMGTLGSTRGVASGVMIERLMSKSAMNAYLIMRQRRSRNRNRRPSLRPSAEARPGINGWPHTFDIKSKNS